MGVDSQSHDLTDFGGGVSYGKDGDAVTGALREFREETLAIFPTLTPSDVESCPVLYNHCNLILFLRTDLSPVAISRAFLTRYQKVVEAGEEVPEVCGITWLTWDEFQGAIHLEESPMFYRVQRFLSRCGEFGHLL
jgi:hypothetical protein